MAKSKTKQPEVTKVVIKPLKIREGRIQTVLGLAYKKKFEIQLEHDQDSKEFQNTAVHECLHCYFPDLEEETVTKIANGISDCLWKLGYRRIMK